MNVRRLVRDHAEVLDLVDRATVGERGGDRRSEDYQTNRDNRTVDSEGKDRGTTRQYALRRLRRDRPDLAESE